MRNLEKPRPTSLTEQDIAQPFWSLSIEESYNFLKTSFDGLSEEEAAARLRFFGLNEIPEDKKLAKIILFFNQFKSPLIFILLIAAIVTAFLREWVETGVITAAILVNAWLGFYQENKAERVLQLLKSYILARTKIRRSGREYEIDSAKLVPGDIIRISQGDRISADGRILFANNFLVDESVLTGESLPVYKSIDNVVASATLGDRTNMVFSGTLATDGMAEILVISTGVNTEFGKIAKLVKTSAHEQTPLQRSMSRFVSKAGIILGIMVVGMFVFGLLRGHALFDMFLIAIAVAVSAIPEGLPIALTVILAVGVERLGSRKGVVRKLLAAETLGSTDIILTDKTGTLTQAKMELSDIVCFDASQKESRDTKNVILQDALMNMDVLIENPESDFAEWKIVGKPIEIALVFGAAHRSLKINSIQKEYQRIDFVPFNSTNKFSVSLFKNNLETKLAIVGAPEIILNFTNTSEILRNKILEEINRRALAGERVLGVISKEMPGGHDKIISFQKRETKEWQHQFKNHQFKGLLAFRDPLRPTVKDAIFRIQQAGIRTIIVTGDHKGTAFSIAKELGLANEQEKVLTGDDIALLSNEELKGRIVHTNVFARVTPEQKLLLTNLCRETGAVVAVTGDGINDAPALAAADIGIAVGSGTDVAKNQADLIILDNNFETIVAAIEEGRTILDNIQKVVVYLISDSLDELLLIGGSLFAGIALPINALQILFVNFFSDSFPALAFAFEQGVDGLGKHPRKFDKNLLDKKMRFLIVGISATTSLFLFVLYYLLLMAQFDEAIVRTFIFASFSSYTLFLAFSLRSLNKSIVQYNPFANHYLTTGIVAGLLLTLCAIYVPWLNAILGTTPLPFLWLIGVLGIGIFNIILAELIKLLFRKHVV